MGTIRVIIAKVGLDGHDRGAKVVAGHGVCGIEIIYTPAPEPGTDCCQLCKKTPTESVSILSGAHMTLFTQVLNLLAELDARTLLCSRRIVLKTTSAI